MVHGFQSPHSLPWSWLFIDLQCSLFLAVSMHSLENYLRGRNCALASSFVLCTKTTFKMSQINYWSKLGKLITFYEPAQNVFDCDGLWYNDLVPFSFYLRASRIKSKIRKGERERERRKERENPPAVEWHFLRLLKGLNERKKVALRSFAWIARVSVNGRGRKTGDFIDVPLLRAMLLIGRLFSLSL